ncbi:MAG TPA: hypothetical protein VN777_00455, partial [Terriglobales bacterium]|nr:hypothetical protein [Terriglobales bacterium]
LGHADDLPELNLPIAGRRRIFSEQLGCNPQGFDFLFHSLDFLLFYSEYFKGILHREGSFHHCQDQLLVSTNSKPQDGIEKHHESTRLKWLVRSVF